MLSIPKRLALALLVVGIVVFVFSLIGDDPPGAANRIPDNGPNPNAPVLGDAARSNGVEIPQKAWVALAKPTVPVLPILDAPSGSALMEDTQGDGIKRAVVITNPTSLGERAIFLVKQLSVNGYVEVYLPERPNESSGFIPAEQVDIIETKDRIVVKLGERKVRLYRSGTLAAEFNAVVGKDETPTPTGLFYIQMTVQNTTDTEPTYGPYTLALSGHSDAIKNTREFENGLIALHGTYQTEYIGQAASHGCIRIANEDITALIKADLGVGTPVEIFP